MGLRIKHGRVVKFECDSCDHSRAPDRFYPQQEAEEKITAFGWQKSKSSHLWSCRSCVKDRRRKMRDLLKTSIEE